MYCRQITVISMSLLLLLSSVALAEDPVEAIAQEEDPIVQTIDKALQEYRNEQFNAAATNLEYARQLIQQKKGEVIKKLLPDPLTGWRADEATSNTVGTAMFGGGLSAERRYSKDNSSLIIKFVTDSPLLQSVIMMFSSPMFAASSGKLELIKGQKAIVDYSGRSGKINIVIANHFLVTIEGQEVERQTMIDYAKQIDMEKLMKLP